MLVPTPNPSIFAAAATQRIRRAKIALLGPILPLHNPIHVAEEIAMLDVLSGGRLLLLFLRGVPYELRAFSVNLDETRAMTQEATLLIIRALTDPQPFSWEGKYYRYQTVSVWPGLIQRPHPPLYSTGNSFESAAFAASQGHGLALSFAPLSYIAQVIPHYREEAAKHGWEPQEDQILFRGNIVAADTDEEAQQLGSQLATLPHLKRPQGPPAASAPSDGGERKASPVAPVLIGEAQFCGSPHTLVSQMKTLNDMGVGVVDLVVPTGLMTQAQVLHSLELLAREVLPRIHDFAGA
jgi:alkanesulfonate monooxygenase SsuD/methylene tetrahydromethanopterin reductase-like flavin-dependent oxidoreductase (luciferase family)